MSMMQQVKLYGGTDLPNITLYYKALLLEAISQWWNEENRDNWEWEQDELPVSLKEWALFARDHLGMQTKYLMTSTLGKFWKRMQPILSSGVSPLASFLWHPCFHTALSLSNFSIWEEKGLAQFCALGKDGQIYSQGQTGNIIGEVGIFPYQFKKVNNL